MSRSGINIRGFTGMNNIKDAGRFWANAEAGVAEPRIVVNADAGVSGALTRREDAVLYVDLPGAHSLWAGRSCMLCAAQGVLYRVMQGEVIPLCDLSGPNLPFVYEEAEGRVYVSNQYNTGIVDPAKNAWHPWGVPLPPGPATIPCDGGLPPGVYHVTMTNAEAGELSGNGPVAEIELTETGGIEVVNRPGNALVWVTDANGPIFYYAGALNRIVDMPGYEPLPSFLCQPPPNLTQLCYAFGRMWGVDGDRLVYSEPFALGWFKPTTNYFQLDAEGTVIAKVPTGLFVGTRKSTRFFGGTVPEEMVQSDAGAASIPGTLAYANNLPELGDVLGTPEKGYVDVPVWRTTEGIVAGNASGRLFNLTKNKLRMGAPAWGASLYRTVGGNFQYITTAPLAQAGADGETSRIFRAGKAHTSAAGFYDTAEAEVRRGGELI